MTPWERDGWKPSDEHASLVCAAVYPNDALAPRSEEDVSPLGFVFVIKRAVFTPLYKLPGGRKEPGEDPLMTAVREMREETGLALSETDLEYVDGIHLRNPQPHWNFLFRAAIPQSALTLMHPFDPGNEGEDPEFISVRDVHHRFRSKSVLFPHYERMLRNKLLPAG